ncbi:hypothetical protein A2U01_0062768, partial [Trifolium medium]|nr:hypothetical protein [Trifolium medium]
SYAWGPATLAFCYWELTNVTIPRYKYLAGYATLLQACINHHFNSICREEDDEYEEHFP